MEATQESLEIATRQYREGEVDLDRVNNLRKDLIVQLDLETATRGQTTIALIRVYKTMGGGWTLGTTTGLEEIPEHEALLSALPAQEVTGQNQWGSVSTVPSTTEEATRSLFSPTILAFEPGRQGTL